MTEAEIVLYDAIRLSIMAAWFTGRWMREDAMVFEDVADDSGALPPMWSDVRS